MDPQTCEDLVEALVMSKTKHNFHLWAYVFMPEHIHLLIWPAMKEYSISKFLRTLKMPVAKKVMARVKARNLEMLNSCSTGKKSEPYHFWTPGGGFDRNIVKPETIVNSINYIHRNPVRRGLVENPEDWYWSSYREWKEEGAGP